MPISTLSRTAEIQNRLNEYRKHKDDPYAYSDGEIDAVRELREHAARDIEFLHGLVTEKK